jgi:predicted NAD/FAD-binding protein
VTLEGISHPVDTGFLVYNTQTYPNLTALFAYLGVASVETEMSFAVSLEEPRLEWAGSSLATVFGQKRNLLRRDFWRMLADILRFNRESVAWIERYPDYDRSLRDFLAAGGYSRPFAEWYLLPMAAAIWSCPAGRCSTTRSPASSASAAITVCCRSSTGRSGERSAAAGAST